MREFLGALAISAIAAFPANAESAFRLGDAVSTPDWLTLEGEARVRYESLDGQFRANGTGGDQLLLFRTLLLAEVDAEFASFGVELQDSRTYLGDDGTPLSSSIANPLDVLQAYIRFDELPGVLGEGSTGSLTLGRQTISLGSKRQIERVDFANVIKSYTGGLYTSQNADGDQFHAMLAVPTARFPNDKEELFDNVLSGDEEQWNRRIWSLHYRHANAVPALGSEIWGEVFVYGLNETDSDAFPTPNRDYVAPGFRIYRKPKVDQWDIDLEVAGRFGSRRASSADNTGPELDVSAAMTFLALGYTFDTAWSPRIAFEYYYASGDDDPNDDAFGQHERLFGSRRSDLNNTSIHGPLTPANLNAPGFRVEVKPNKRWDGRFYYHAASLASDTNAWVIAKLRDPNGQSGSFIGHTLDARARYWVVPESLRFEVGASALLHGEFAKTAPNAPEADDTYFGYLQLTFDY